MSEKRTRVWVVEQCATWSDDRRWYPLIDYVWTRADPARNSLRDLRERDLSGEYRLARYERVERKRRK